MRFTARLWLLALVTSLSLPFPLYGQEPANEQPAEPAAAAGDESAADHDQAAAGHDVDEAVLTSGTQVVTPAAGQQPAKSADAKPDAKALPSAAEKIARLERAIETDAKRLEEVQSNLNVPGDEYAKAEAAFQELDVARAEIQQKLAKLAEGEQQEELERLQAEAAALEKKWMLAKERFDLAFGERKTMQENVDTLKRKLDSDRALLDKLKSPSEPLPLDSPPADAAPPQPVSQAERPDTPAPAQPAPVAVTPTPAPASPGQPATPPTPPTPPQPEAAQGAAMPPAADSTPFLSKKIAKELAEASVAAQKSQDAAKAAEDKAQTITERIEMLQKDIDQQRQLRDTARKTVDNSEKTVASLNEELFSKLMAGESVDATREQIREATQRLYENHAKARRISTGLDDLQSRLAQLQAEQLTAMKDAELKRQNADRDQQTVVRLRNPYTARNLLQWLIDHGPPIAGILLGLALFMWLSRVLETRLVALTAQGARRGGREERENRARTLFGIFRNVANIAAICAAAVMILQVAGVSVAPLIGGAAVFGLAVAFGAQSLIKDYFTGFMVLFEQQYLVNDVVSIGDIKGQVERISLRITVLRDLEGRVHFIPHSQINTVTNMTHGWSRAVFEIGVAYKENVDHVIDVLTRLAGELRRDEGYRLLILSDPVMLGVDAFGDSAVVIKFYIQTRPLQQWTVRREMLRRIKNEFDRLGIEIPFPHVTVYRGTAQAQHAADEQSDDWRDRDVA